MTPGNARHFSCGIIGFPKLKVTGINGERLCPDIPNGPQSNIKKQPPTPSAVRLFTRIAKEITIAARAGGGDPETNNSLAADRGQGQSGQHA